MSSVPPIVSALEGFLRGAHVRRVYYAEQASTPPPQLAYLVHFPRLAVTLSGRDSMWVEHNEKASLIRPEAGDAVVVPANCWNRPIWTGAASTLNVLFGSKQVGLSLVSWDAKRSKTPTVHKTTLASTSDEVARNIMQALLGLIPDSNGASILLIEALMRACLSALRTTVSPSKRRATVLYDSICMYVQENFHFALTRDAVAAHFRVSPNHLSRLFNREGMVGFNEYVTYVRINRAKYLIKHYRQTIDEVAAACGFSEASYFCRIFKRKTKLTPSAYRSGQLQVGTPAKLEPNIGQRRKRLKR